MSSASRCYDVVWDEANGVVRTNWHPDAVCGIAEARAVTAEISAMGRGRVLQFVDLRGIDAIDRPGREHFMNASADFRAVALVADSGVTKMIANFFLTLKRGSIPVKIFTTEADAMTWLRRQP